ncbi:hypothetical protein J3E71DRAFT_357460 [Bipolaris maydis]|nr:hypothetical protein J3E71DRAFT_357533 [Bipolaris maydis]KAJ6276552.1 hypothetical protein J3E71DRAFT_357460 [Bipolaris maydis]
MGFLASPSPSDNVCNVPHGRALELNGIISHANYLTDTRHAIVISDCSFTPAGSIITVSSSNLGQSPYAERIRDIDELKKFAKKAQMMIHPDRLLREHASEPPDVHLATLNGLIDCLSELESDNQCAALRELNERARDGWRSTWSIDNKIGSWNPHQTPGSGFHTSSPFQGATTDGRSHHSTDSQEHRHRRNAYSTSESARYTTHRSAGEPILISSDEEDNASAEPRSAARPCAGPRHQRDRFQTHLSNSGTRVNFRYKMSEKDLVALGRRIEDLGTKKIGAGPIVVIGMVRRRRIVDVDAIPEHCTIIKSTLLNTCAFFACMREVAFIFRIFLTVFATVNW